METMTIPIPHDVAEAAKLAAASYAHAESNEERGRYVVPEAMKVVRFALTLIATQQQEAAERDKAVTEEWLRTFSALEISDSKRLAYIVAWCGAYEISWCPPCGDFPPCICMDRRVVKERPTRGELFDLLKVLKIQAKGGE